MFNIIVNAAVLFKPANLGGKSFIPLGKPSKHPENLVVAETADKIEARP